jgi:hypothetical protein
MSERTYPEPWERQEGEGDKPFRAFTIYRDMGAERSLRKVAQTIGHNQKVTCEHWSRKFGWVDRVRKYEDHLDSLKRKAEEGERMEMAKRHARQMQRTASFLELLTAEAGLRATENPALLKGLPFHDLVRWVIRIGPALARVQAGEALARGGPTARIELPGAESRQEDQVVHALLTDPEAADIAIQLLERIAGESVPGPSDAGRAGVDRVGREVATRPAPSTPQS